MLLEEQNRKKFEDQEAERNAKEAEKLAAEKTDLDKQIADADATVRSLGKLRTSLSTQV